MGKLNEKELVTKYVEDILTKPKELEYTDTEKDKVKSLEMLALAQKHNLVNEIQVINAQLGNFYWRKGTYDKSIEHFFKALELLEDDSNALKGDVLNGLGNAYIKIEMYDQALIYFNKAIAFANEQDDDKFLSSVLNNIGTLYEELKNEELALKYYRQSLEKTINVGFQYGIAITNYNVGNMCYRLGDFEEAEKHISLAIDYSKKHDVKMLLAHAHLTLGTMRKAEHECEASIENFKIAVKNASESNDNYILFHIYLELASTYQLLKLFVQAKEYYYKAELLAKHLKIEGLLANVYQKTAALYHENGYITESLQYYKKFSDINKLVEEKRIIERKKTIEYQSKLSVSLEETKTYQTLSNELKKSYDSMKVLSEIGQSMTSTHDIKAIFGQLYENINKLMDAEWLSVSLFDPSSNQLRFDLLIEDGKYLDSYALSLDNKRSFAVWSYLHKQTILLNDAENEYHQYIEGIGSTRGRMMKSIMVSPLSVEGEVIGVFSIQSLEKNAYSGTHKVLLQTLSSYLAIAIKNANRSNELATLNLKLKAKSEQDGLTQIPNRRLFDERFNELWDEALKNKNYIGVVILDVDNFKEFNDSYGHLVGDEVLKSVAKLLDKHKGANDFVARYGGDEFIGVFPNSTIESLTKFDNALRLALKNVSKEIGIATEVTLSMGVAQTIPKENDKKVIIYTADNQLYESKANGKNTSSYKMI